jgi:hypothetical protein
MAAVFVRWLTVSILAMPAVFVCQVTRVFITALPARFALTVATTV